MPYVLLAGTVVYAAVLAWRYSISWQIELQTICTFHALESMHSSAQNGWGWSGQDYLHSTITTDQLNCGDTCRLMQKKRRSKFLMLNDWGKGVLRTMTISNVTLLFLTPVSQKHGKPLMTRARQATMVANRLREVWRYAALSALTPELGKGLNSRKTSCEAIFSNVLRNQELCLTDVLETISTWSPSTGKKYSSGKWTWPEMKCKYVKDYRPLPEYKIRRLVNNCCSIIPKQM